MPLTPLADHLPEAGADAVAWAGWCGPGAGGVGARTDAVAAVGGLLIDLVLLDPPAGPRPAPSAASRRLLASASPATLPGGGEHWAAFGLRAAVPADWSPSLTRHEPAASVLALAGPERSRLTARLWRRGMADTWFDGDAAALLDASTPAGIGPVATASGAVTAAGVEPCRAWARWSGKARRRRDLLWHDADANAVLGVTVRGPRQADLPDPAGFLPAAP